MKLFSKKDKKNLSDIHAAGSKSSLYGTLTNRGKTINLKPFLHKRYPVIALVLLLVGSLTLFTLWHFLTRAETSDFYPRTCLGTWINPQNAIGQPETLDNSGTLLTEENSATENATSAQIFCANFLPVSYQGKGNIKYVGLTLVWKIGDVTTTAVPTDPTLTQGVSSTSTSTLESPISPTSTDKSSSSTTSFWNGFKYFPVQTVLASDSSTQSIPLPEPESNPTPEIVTTSDSISTYPDAGMTKVLSEERSSLTGSSSEPLTSMDIPTSTITQASSGASTSEIVPLPPVIDNNFLKVSYSTDGKTWVEIGKVSPDNWKNFTIALPVNDWESLRKLQIQIESIPTLVDPLPKVYLDGMFIETHYELSNISPAESDERTKDRTLSTHGKMTADKTTYGPHENIQILDAAANSAVEIYALDDPDSAPNPTNVYATMIPEDGATQISTDTLSPGRYVLVNTFDPGQCGGYTLDQCRTDTAYVGETSVTVLQQ